jgi:hypothetical protein
MDKQLAFFGFTSSLDLLCALISTYENVEQGNPIQCPKQIEILSRCYVEGKANTLAFLDNHIDIHVTAIRNRDQIMPS